MLNILDKIAKFIIDLIHLLKQKFHNKVTLLIVASGLTLIGSSIYERFVNAFVEKIYDTTISSYTEPLIGIVLIFISLRYNLESMRIESTIINDNPETTEANKKNNILGSTVEDSDTVDLSKVIDQGVIDSFTDTKYSKEPLSVKDLPNYFFNFAKENIQKKYLFDSGVHEKKQ